MSKTMVLVSMFAALGLACADDAGSDSGGETAGDGDGDGDGDSSGDGDGDTSGDGDGDGEIEGVLVSVVEADCAEAPVAGIRVIAQTPDGTLVEQTTGADGKTAFPELVDGAAAITIVLPDASLWSVVDVPAGVDLKSNVGTDPDLTHLTLSGTISGKLDDANWTAIFSSCGHYSRGEITDYELPVPAGRPFELFAYEFIHTPTDRGFTQQFPRVHWSSHEALSEDTVFDFSFPEQGFPVSVSGSLSLTGLDADHPLQPQPGAAASGNVVVHDRNGWMPVSGLTSFEFNEALDAVDYTIEHIAEEQLEDPITAYYLWADSVPPQWVQVMGTPKAGAHSPDFIELPETAGADATVPVLYDGLELAPYPFSEGVDVRLILGIPFTTNTWTIQSYGMTWPTMLTIPIFPGDPDQKVLFEDATNIDGELGVLFYDGSVPGFYTAGSAVKITAKWD